MWTSASPRRHWMPSSSGAINPRCSTASRSKCSRKSPWTSVSIPKIPAVSVARWDVDRLSWVFPYMPTKTPITVAHGDGIGPEIMAATLQILEAAGAAIEPEIIEIGEKVYLRGNTSGIEASAWDSLRRTKVFLKAPITTPQGGGFKSLNVTARKTLGLYANVRPCVS